MPAWLLLATFLTTAQSERMIPAERPNLSFTVGMRSGVSETEEGRHRLFSVSGFGFWKL